MSLHWTSRLENIQHCFWSDCGPRSIFGITVSAVEDRTEFTLNHIRARPSSCLESQKASGVQVTSLGPRWHSQTPCGYHLLFSEQRIKRQPVQSGDFLGERLPNSPHQWEGRSHLSQYCRKNIGLVSLPAAADSAQMAPLVGGWVNKHLTIEEIFIFDE